MDANKPPVQPQKKLLAMALDIGATIAVPLVALALTGRLLDEKWQRSPLFLLIGMALAILISIIILYRKIKPLL